MTKPEVKHLVLALSTRCLALGSTMPRVARCSGGQHGCACRAEAGGGEGEGVRTMLGACMQLNPLGQAGHPVGSKRQLRVELGIGQLQLLELCVQVLAGAEAQRLRGGARSMWASCAAEAAGARSGHPRPPRTCLVLGDVSLLPTWWAYDSFICCMTR